VKLLGVVHISLACFRGFAFLVLCVFVHAAHQSLHQLAGILEIALPQEHIAFASQTVRHVGGQSIVGKHYFARHRQIAFRLPARAEGFLAFGPLDHGGFLG
jgi:hypothetical protein